MFDYRPTHKCNELRIENFENHVTLSGWVNRQRDHGGLIFIDLRDRFGITQIVFDPDKNKKLHAYAETLRAEWVISIKGTVLKRREGMANPNLDTGDIEVEVHEMEILSKSKTPPFSICDENLDVKEDTRLTFRYLDIRKGKIAKNLILRHKAMLSTRNYLSRQGFIEISTPILGKSTPEGARDYLVPSRIHPGSFYALPQSPQLFKQLLMIAGMDKYFQIAPCFRDEDLRSDRQPEFTQIDIEMSFGYPEDLQAIIEELIKSIIKESMNIDIAAPFRRMPYKEAIDRFGTDKPDTRFGMELINLDDIAKKSTFNVFINQQKEGGIVKGLLVKGGATISRREIENYTEFVGKLGIHGLAWMKMQEGNLTSSIVKFFEEDLQKVLINRMQIENGDLIFIIADQKDSTHRALDHLRRRLAHDLSLIPEDHLDFLWVTDFPLFCRNSENNNLEYLHHPFTSPHIEDIHLLDTDPLKVRSYGYDIILNGYELGGGSQRIHDPKLQKKVFDLLQITEKEQQEKFGFFLEALNYGTPPHLGIALGLDRLIMILAKAETIRDVIAFPKTKNSNDLMMQCPAPVTNEQLKELGISIEESAFFME